MLRLVRAIGVVCLLAACGAQPAALAGTVPGAGAPGTTIKRPPPKAGDLPRLMKEIGGKDLVKADLARKDILVLLKGDSAGAAMSALERGLTRGNRETKTAVIGCLAESGRRDALELVADRLNDSDKWVKLCALAGMRKCKVKDEKFLSEVRDLLDEDDPLLRKEAILALGHLKDAEAAEHLIGLMEGKDPGLRENAKWALEKIAGKKLGSNPQRWRTWLKTKEKLEDREYLRKQKESMAMRRAVQESIKPKEKPLDRTTLHLSLSFSGLAVLVLLAASVWLLMPSWLHAKMKATEKEHAAGTGVSVAKLARRFRASDIMPDFVVYPYLLSVITNGSSPVHKETALRLVELRAFGGCRLLTDKKRSRGRGEPTKVAPTWVGRLPRSLLEDVAVLRGPGRRLIQILDPANPRWKKEASRDEVRKAQRSYRSWLRKN
jgi:hypothetical protein